MRFTHLPFLLVATAPIGLCQEKPVTQPAPSSPDIKTESPARIPTPALPAPPPLGGGPLGSIGLDSLSAEAIVQAVPGALGGPDRVHFDEPGDGRVWVNAPGYKASFSAEGFTFIPFLGSGAPRNFPLRFTIMESSVDGEALPLAAPRVTKGNQSVDIDRGAFTERYHIGLKSVEQTFVIEALPTRGAIRFALELDTELTPRRGGDGIVLEGPSGGVHIGDVTVFDARGRSMSTSTQLVGGQLVIELNEAYVQEAALPIVIDPVISTWSYSDTRALQSPEVSYDETNQVWLVCMEEIFSQTDTDVSTVLRNRDGSEVLGSKEYVDFTTETWITPRAANNNIANNFLVVAERFDGTERQIWGRTRDASGNVLSPQFMISGASSGDKLRPDVGGDPLLIGPTYYCVVWQREYSPTDRDIHYRLVNSDATLFGTGTQQLDNSSATDDRSPAISNSNGKGPFQGQRWNVAWERRSGSIFASNSDIHAGQLDWQGNVVTPSFGLVVSSSLTTTPSVSSPLEGANGQRRWACAWRSAASIFGQGDIGMLAMIGGSPQSSTNLTNLEELTFGTSHGVENQSEPIVVSDGTEYRVSYVEGVGGSNQDLNVVSTTLSHDASQLALVTGRIPLATSTTIESNLRAASEGDSGGEAGRMMSVWRDAGTIFALERVEGALTSQSTAWEQISTSACTGTNNSGGGRAYARVLGSPSISTNRIRLDVHDLPPSVFGFFVTGPALATIPVGQGVLCIGQVRRLDDVILNSNLTLSVSRSVDLTNLPIGVQISVGAQYFQFWHRDVVNGGATSNLSDAAGVMFTN